MRRQPTPDAVKQAILRLHAAGVRPYLIAEQVGVSRSTVTQVTKQAHKEGELFCVEEYLKELVTI